MATREELIDALRQADDAGNVEDAQGIAEIIRSGAYQPTPTDVPSLESIFGTEQQIADELEPGFFEKETGRLAGSISGGITGGRIGAAYGPWGIVGGGAIGAGIGGFTGDVAQSQYQIATDSELAPKTTDEMLDRALIAGGEEALYDLAGGLLFKAGSKAWSAFRPKKIEGIEEIQEQITKHGGSLTASQMTNNRLVDTVEGLVASTWGGAGMKEARAINDGAIAKYTSDYINHFNKTADEILTDEGLGTLFLEGVKAGNKIHSKLGGDMYSHLDTLYKPLMQKKLITTETPTGILDVAGQMLSKKTSQVVEKELLPVSTTELKNFARNKLKGAAPIKGKSLGTWTTKELNDILKFDDRISFKLAQEYRSKLLEEGRIAASGTGTKLGQGGTTRMVSELQGLADNMIEQGALATKNPEFIASWRSANSFWKKGKEIFSNDFVNKLVNKNASAIGKKLFNSDIEDIRKAKKALRAAQVLSIKSDTPVAFSKTWRGIQQGYLQSILAEAIQPASKAAPGGEISIVQISKWLTKDTAKNKKLMAAFTKEQRDGIQTFVNSVKAMQKTPVGEGSFMVKVGQAGLIINSLTGSIPGAQFTGDVMTYTIGPQVLAKLLTNPYWAKKIAGVNRMSGRPKLGTAAWASVMKLIAASQDINIIGE